MRILKSNKANIRKDSETNKNIISLSLQQVTLTPAFAGTVLASSCESLLPSSVLPDRLRHKLDHEIHSHKTPSSLAPSIPFSKRCNEPQQPRTTTYCRRPALPVPSYGIYQRCCVNSNTLATTYRT